MIPHGTHCTNSLRSSGGDVRFLDFLPCRFVDLRDVVFAVVGDVVGGVGVLLGCVSISLRPVTVTSPPLYALHALHTLQTVLIKTGSVRIKG